MVLKINLYTHWAIFLAWANTQSCSFLSFTYNNILLPMTQIFYFLHLSMGRKSSET